MTDSSPVLEWTVRQILKPVSTESDLVWNPKHNKTSIKYWLKLGMPREQALERRKIERRKYCREMMRALREQNEL